MTTTRAVHEVVRLPLSLNQQFLCAFDAGGDSGPFGPHYHSLLAWRVSGAVDIDALRAALADVVRRHEPLRTVIVRAGRLGYQQVHPPCQPSLVVRDCPDVPAGDRDRHAGQLLNDAEAGSVSPDEIPQLRAELVRFDQTDAVLTLRTHHTAADGWSMRILGRDMVACYTARRSGTEPDLPPLRTYRQFVAWERRFAARESMAAAKRYWRDTLDGVELTALRADHPRSAALPPVSSAYRFAIEPGPAARVTALARRERCSPFMVMLAAYYRLVHRITGATDIVVPTNTPGRGNGLFDDTVGSFFNFLPLRVDLAGCRDARSLLERTRAACLGAYTHDVPAIHVFDAAPGLLASARHDWFAPVTFQMLPSHNALDGRSTGEIVLTEVRQRDAVVPVTSQIPDGALWTFSPAPSGELQGSLVHRTDRFDTRTVMEFAEQYRRLLSELVAEAGAPVDDDEEPT